MPLRSRAQPPAAGRVRRTAAVLVLCLLAAACGSTVQVGQQTATVAGGTQGTVPVADGMSAQPAGGAALPADGVAGSVSSGAPGSAPAVAGGGAGGGTAAGAAGTPPGGGSAGTAGGDGNGGAGAGGSSQTAGIATGEGPIRLGFIVLKNGEAFVSGLGTEASFGNGRRHVEAAVGDLNDRGGIAGRKVEPFFAEVDAAAADPEANYAAACTKLTQDDRVFAILTPINVREGVVACAAQARTPLINASFNPGDNYLYERFGDYFYSPSMLNLDNGVLLMLNTLRREGALDGDTKIGLLYTSTPQFQRVVENTFVPTLEAWGVPHEVAGAAAYNAAQINSAQLQFASSGVNLVMFVAPNGIRAAVGGEHTHRVLGEGDGLVEGDRHLFQCRFQHGAPAWIAGGQHRVRRGGCGSAQKGTGQHGDHGQ
jgi:ABC-type branched-subunit amino acid transport system substrate-binding protein